MLPFLILIMFSVLGVFCILRVQKLKTDYASIKVGMSEEEFLSLKLGRVKSELLDNGDILYTGWFSRHRYNYEQWRVIVRNGIVVEKEPLTMD